MSPHDVAKLLQYQSSGTLAKPGADGVARDVPKRCEQLLVVNDALRPEARAGSSAPRRSFFSLK